MNKALNLDDINRVANAGAPRDGVFVSRRFLAQVHAELYSARNQQAALDYVPSGNATLVTDISGHVQNVNSLA